MCRPAAARTAALAFFGRLTPVLALTHYPLIAWHSPVSSRWDDVFGCSRCKDTEVTALSGWGVLRALLDGQGDHRAIRIWRDDLQIQIPGWRVRLHYEVYLIQPGETRRKAGEENRRRLPRDARIKLDRSSMQCKLCLRRRRIEQAVTGRDPAAVCCQRTRQLRPFLHWCVCPYASMTPGRRWNMGEAVVALP